MTDEHTILRARNAPRFFASAIISICAVFGAFFVDVHVEAGHMPDTVMTHVPSEHEELSNDDRPAPRKKKPAAAASNT